MTKKTRQPKQKTQESDKAEGWTNSQFRDLCEFNELALEEYGFIHCAAELSAEKWGGFTSGIKGLFSSGSNAAKIEQGGYSITKTVANNLASRPYINSPSTTINIMKFGTNTADKFFKKGVNYRATDTFRSNQGVWKLGINPKTNVIYHFLFKPLK